MWVWVLVAARCVASLARGALVRFPSEFGRFQAPVMALALALATSFSATRSMLSLRRRRAARWLVAAIRDMQDCPFSTVPVHLCASIDCGGPWRVVLWTERERGAGDKAEETAIEVGRRDNCGRWAMCQVLPDLLQVG